MENGAYEDEANKSARHLQQQFHPHRSYHQGQAQFAVPNPTTMFDPYRNAPEGHVYEDIAYSLEPGGFQRNLTLPLRRTSQSCESLETGGVSSSVRVTSRERRASVIDRLSRESSLDNSCSSVERPSRRRRKKDCRHCRTKVPVAEEQRGYEDRNDELRAIFGLPNVGLCHLPPGCGLGPPVVYAIGCNSAECSNGLTSGGADLAHVECDKGLVTHHQRNRAGMKVNSIYAQDHWHANGGKDPSRSIFLNDPHNRRIPKEDATSPFQRSYSAVSANSPSSDNRTNLRRSGRDDSEHPARLKKHRHGWSMQFERPFGALSASTANCTKSLVLLLIVVLALLGIGGLALYIVIEPDKIQVIQQYLRSSKNSTSFVSDNELNQDLEEPVSPTTTFLAPSTTSPSPVPSMSFEGNSNDLPDAFVTAISISTSSKLSTLLMPSTTTTTTTTTRRYVTPSSTTTTRTTTLLAFPRPCNECLADEVCVAKNADDSAQCQAARDRNDPNGCGGLCDYQTQTCHKEDDGSFRCVESEHHCLDDEWTCLNIFCIPSVKRCDGQMNCYDHSDEYNCECDLNTHFHCGNQTSCLHLSKKCDGHVDCFDASDEENCTTSHEFGKQCPSPNEQTCANKQQCYLKTRFCDGYKDCDDGSDEPLGCQLGRCNKHEFSCRNGRCIDKTLKCNQMDDCGDGSDEKHCRGM